MDNGKAVKDQRRTKLFFPQQRTEMETNGRMHSLRYGRIVRYLRLKVQAIKLKILQAKNTGPGGLAKTVIESVVKLVQAMRKVNWTDLLRAGNSELSRRLIIPMVGIIVFTLFLAV